MDITKMSRHINLSLIISFQRSPLLLKFNKYNSVNVNTILTLLIQIKNLGSYITWRWLHVMFVRPVVCYKYEDRDLNNKAVKLFSGDSHKVLLPFSQWLSALVLVFSLIPSALSVRFWKSFILSLLQCHFSYR